MVNKLLFFIAFSVSICAQSFTGGFNFYLPPQDSLTTKFLPKFPVKNLTDKDFISVNSNGNFSANGKEIKFWGTNCVADGAFPDKTKTWFIAARLRKLGYNLIRFHHMDNNWAGSLLEKGKDTRHLDPVVLDRLDNFLADLKKNGIYADINLHVGRTFNKLDGVLYADSIPDYGKGVTIFDKQLIFLQKEYASQLLTHVNPYTGLSLINDPVMAMVEITNENSLYRMWRNNVLKPFALGGSLIIRHCQMLDSAWNKFLEDKYSTTANLASVWNAGLTSSGSQNLVINGDFEGISITSNWTMELHESAAATMAKDVVNPYAGIASAKISVSKVTGTDWHIQWKQVGMSIKKDSLYSVEFAAKADTNCTISVSVMRDNDPYTGYASKNFQVTKQWQVFSFSFKPSEDNTGKTRLSFSFNNRVGNYWFDYIKMVNSGTKGLIAGEAIELGTVRRLDYIDCNAYSAARVKDMSAFYIKLQDDYYDEMQNYLKSTLGVKVPVTGTNWNVGQGDMITQSRLDYTDNHSYWDHPNFPNIPWSSTDWTIANQPMVKSTTGGTIPALIGGVPFKGKPFTISEYNHGYPNRYQTEAMLFSTAYGAFNDVDAIMFFDYNGAKDWETDKVDQYFDTHRNSAYMSLVPSCAYAYRNNFISKSKDVIYLSYKRDDINALPANDMGGWQGQTSFNRILGLKYAIRNESFDSQSPTDFSLLPAAPVNPFVTTTKEITFNTDGLLLTETPCFAAAAGFLNNFPNAKAANMTIKSANDFGVITWVSLNSDSLSVANTSLITLSSKIQNSQMIWDGITSVHNNWGSAPTQMYPLNVTLSLKIFADSIRVYPLDPRGLESSTGLVTIFPSAPNAFDFTIDQNVYRSLWFGIEKFGQGTLTPVNSKKESNIQFYRLEQNYPNPFNPSTVISFALPYESKVKLTISDVLGRVVKILINQTEKAGNYKISFNGANLASGIYFYSLSAKAIENNGKEFYKSGKMQLIK